MKFSTRARYGLRMMVELTRALQDRELVHLGRIAKVTGLSVNYLAQLTIPLKTNGLLIGVSGKRGGYRLAKPPDQITVRDILEAVQGPVGLTDCVNNPELCLNSSFCEARTVWVIAGYKMMEVFDQYSLADLISKDWLSATKREYAHVPLLDPDRFLAKGVSESQPGCPVKTRR